MTLAEQKNAGTEQPSGKSQYIRKYGTILGFMIFTLFKFGKYAFLLLKLAKFQSLLSMVFAVGIYAIQFGWPFAFGFVLLIFVHELGHALVLRNEGIDASLPVFIPFLGAFIAMRGQPRNAWVEAKVGIGGPILGTFASILTYFAGVNLNSDLLLALAYSGFLINLFNMIPVSPMDGGRIIAGVSRALLIVGLGIGSYVFMQLQSPILLVILVLGALRVYQSYKNPVPGYFEIPKEKKLLMALSYLSLTSFLIYSMQIAHNALNGIVDQNDVILGAAFYSFGQINRPINP